MTFKEFLRVEEADGTDKGLMGYPVASAVRKPSDGQPFKQMLGSVSGQTPRGPSSAGPGPAGFMRKRMRKR